MKLIDFITIFLPISAQYALVKWALRRVYALYQAQSSYARLARYGVDDISVKEDGDFCIVVDKAIL